MKRYWLYAPGENAEEWDEFYAAGIMGLGWDELGDLSQYESKEEIAEVLKDLSGASTNQRNNAKANFDFKYTMKVGDIVIPKNGRKEFLGYGIVTSDYYFDENRENYKSCRKVDWIKKGVWKEEYGSIVIKTLTDVTNYHTDVLGYESYVDRLKQLIGINGPIPSLVHPKNLILYGPPGTGKTYHSIDKAVEIVTDSSSTNHIENKQLFDELRGQGQIEFVTFHQNYSFEDFLVGLRPDVEFEQLRFRSHKGIFYEIAKKARENYESFISGTGKKRAFDEVFQELVKPIESGNEVEIKMASGISFWITELSDTSIHFRKQSGGTAHTLSIATLKDLVEGIRESPAGLAPYYLPLIKIIKEQRETKERAEPIKNFVLIIDEINRANISKVFGELITLLEEDKRIGQENELKITLPNGEKDFGIPPNLYIIGTMNTADKSIALIDIALRRRFEFIGYYPRYEGYDAEAIKLLQHINSAIFERKKSADYLIGHAYFMNNQPIEIVLRNKVIPLLMEYFSGKTEIISSIFEGSGWNVDYDITTYGWSITKT